MRSGYRTGSGICRQQQTGAIGATQEIGHAGNLRDVRRGLARLGLGSACSWVVWVAPIRLLSAIVGESQCTALMSRLWQYHPGGARAKPGRPCLHKL